MLFSVWFKDFGNAWHRVGSVEADRLELAVKPARDLARSHGHRVDRCVVTDGDGRAEIPLLVRRGKAVA